MDNAHRVARKTFGLGAVAMIFEWNGRLEAHINYWGLENLEPDPERRRLPSAIREHRSDTSYVLIVKYKDVIKQINVVHVDTPFLAKSY